MERNEPAAVFERSNSIAELYRFELSNHDYSQIEEYWAITIIPKDDPENFKEHTFLSSFLAEMFLNENGYKEVVL